MRVFFYDVKLNVVHNAHIYLWYNFEYRTWGIALLSCTDTLSSPLTTALVFILFIKHGFNVDKTLLKYLIEIVLGQF